MSHRLLDPGIVWVLERILLVLSAGHKTRPVSELHCRRCRATIVADAAMLGRVRFRWVKDEFLRQHRQCKTPAVPRG